MGYFRANRHYDIFGDDVDGYYIDIINNNNNKDINMAKRLFLSLEDYIKLLIKYNAEKSYKNNEYYFKNRNDCERCCNYLNDTYGLIMVLMEE